MQANEKILLRFMEGNDKNFIIPVYQRNYDWGIEECEQLLLDIENIKDRKSRNYFFGSIVSIDRERDKILIIDGQQRLTTISLLLLAMYHLLESGQNPEAKIQSEKILHEYLINKYSNDESQKIKLKPIKNDALNFNSLFENKELRNDPSRIFINYKYFKAQLSKLNLDEVFAAINEIMIVDIQLKYGEDDPQLIFESINSTGLALTEADKIRNYILMNEDESKQEEYYTNYWRKIEENVNFDTSAFIRDFLSYKTRKIPTKNRVYLEFKNYYSKANENKGIFLNELLQFSKYYHLILNPNTHSNREISFLLQELNTIEVKVVYPALLELFADLDARIINEAALKDILITIINYVIRRALCDLPTNALNKVFLTLIADVKKKPDYSDSYADILKYILCKKTARARFPRNDELEISLQSRNIFKIKNYRDLFFERLENYQNREKVNVADLKLENKIQIEHIIPQTITPNWKKELGEDWENIHSKYLDTLGNLTLTAYNQSMSNLPFLKKKQKGFENSKFYLNQELKKLDKFDLNALQNRLNILTKRVLKIWNYPDSNYAPVNHQEEEFFYSLEDEEPFTNRKIDYIKFGENKKKQVESWVSFYLAVIQHLLAYDLGYMHKFKEIGIEIDKTESTKRNKEVMESVYVNSKISADRIRVNAQKMVSETNFDLSDFKFTTKMD